MPWKSSGLESPGKGQNRGFLWELLGEATSSLVLVLGASRASQAEQLPGLIPAVHKEQVSLRAAGRGR